MKFNSFINKQQWRKWLGLAILVVSGGSGLTLAPILASEGDDQLLFDMSREVARIDLRIYDEHQSKLETYENGTLLEVSSISPETATAIFQNLLKLNMYLNKVQKQFAKDPVIGLSLRSDFSGSATLEEMAHVAAQMSQLNHKLLTYHAHLYLSYRLLSRSSQPLLKKCRFRNQAVAHERIIKNLLAGGNRDAHPPVVRRAQEKIDGDDAFNHSAKNPCRLISGPTRKEMVQVIEGAVSARTRIKLGSRVQVFKDIIRPLLETLTELQNKIESVGVANLYGDIKQLEKNLKNAHINFLMMQADMLKLGQRLKEVKEKVEMLKADPTNLDIFNQVRTLLVDSIGAAVGKTFRYLNEGPTCAVDNPFTTYLFNTPENQKEPLLDQVNEQLRICYEAKVQGLREKILDYQNQPMGEKAKAMGQALQQATYYTRK